VVVGGGIAGLLAARVLAERHLEVRVLDRDDLERATTTDPDAVCRRDATSTRSCPAAGRSWRSCSRA
jgi:glycine/D-amino acid oxidase-like deaminating enzyme